LSRGGLGSATVEVALPVDWNPQQPRQALSSIRSRRGPEKV